MSRNSTRIIVSRVEVIAEPLAVTVETACKLSGLKRSLLYEKMKSGELRRSKVGNRTIILVEDLKEWLRNLPGGRENTIREIKSLCESDTL